MLCPPLSSVVVVSWSVSMFLAFVPSHALSDKGFDALALCVGRVHDKSVQGLGPGLPGCPL